jgi:two-component system, NtrC family, response regulator HydG
VAALPVAVPSLRERIEDLPALVRLFASNAANPTVDPGQLELSEDALKALESYHWPGNLAELNQVIIKVASSAETRVVTAQHLPLRVKDVRKWPTLAEFLAGQERQYIDIVVHACKGDRSAAAAILGVDTSRLH